jgi:hypothetical protein
MSDCRSTAGEKEKMPALLSNDRVLVVDRKLFRDDVTNMFVGVVEDFEDGFVRARGYAYHIHPYEMGTERRAEERMRVFSLYSGDVIYLLPHNLDIAQIQIKRTPKTLILTDGQSFQMDLTDCLARV